MPRQDHSETPLGLRRGTRGHELPTPTHSKPEINPSPGKPTTPRSTLAAAEPSTARSTAQRSPVRADPAPAIRQRHDATSAHPARAEAGAEFDHVLAMDEQDPKPYDEEATASRG